MRRLMPILLAILALPLPALSQSIKHKKKPKNVILMIGDGTGVAQLFAAYAAGGFSLNIFSLAEIIGLSNTSSADDFITDSAAGATAFSTGKKTKNGMLGLAPDSTYLQTLAETFHQNGKSTGLVVTCALTHATPAAFYAHYPDRDSDIAIAKYFYNGNIDVALGGGYPFFDSIKLVQNGYHVNVGSSHLYSDLFPKQVGFFDHSQQMPSYNKGRENYLPMAGEHAVDVLSKNKKGFFLMIEGSQIDWACHNNDSNYLINETLDFDRTAKTVLDWAKADENTLVIITADHECGGLTLTGYDSLHHRPIMNFSTKHHTAIMVPVFAFGPGCETFAGVYENTEIYQKIVELMPTKR